MLFLALSLLVVCCNAQGSWLSTYVYSGTTCTGPVVALAAFSSSGTGGLNCSTTACTCANGFCGEVKCGNSIPAIPAGSVSYTIYDQTGCPSGRETTILAVSATGNCVGFGTVSYTASCNGNRLTITSYTGSSTCQGTNTQASGDLGCTSAGVISINARCGAPCFHEDTEITYKGNNYKMKELQSDSLSECVVPHVVSERGVIVTAMCGTVRRVLKLTGGHLVYTSTGLRAADTLHKGDTVFADTEEHVMCRVTDVQQETTAQRYFGLNCYDSDVLASGIKTSTFEKLHTVPAYWMSIVGRVLGIKNAAAFGHKLNTFAEKVGLL